MEADLAKSNFRKGTIFAGLVVGIMCINSANAEPACPRMEFVVVDDQGPRTIAEPDGNILHLKAAPLLTMTDFTGANVTLTRMADAISSSLRPPLMATRQSGSFLASVIIRRDFMRIPPRWIRRRLQVMMSSFVCLWNTARGLTSGIRFIRERRKHGRDMSAKKTSPIICALAQVVGALMAN